MTLISSQHGLTLGGLDLVLAGTPVVHTEGYTTDVSSNGTDWGNPEVAVAQIISALTDGDIVSRTHVGNRQATVYVRISATASNILPLGEKALAAVTGKAVELKWQPPDIAEPPTIFDVLTSRMDFTFDDFAELRRDRTYVLTLTALPWGRSATKVETAAVTTVAPSVVDSGSATTNWTAPYGPTGATVTVVSGAVTATYNGALINNRPISPFYGTTLRRTASITTTTNKYLAVDWKTTATGYFFLGIPGALLAEHRREPAPVAGFTRSWFKVPDATTSVASIDITLDQAGVSQSGSKTLSVDQVLAAPTLPVSGTARQLSRGLDPGGSVSAQGDVLVQHASAGLGPTIVYSHPAVSGYSPALRGWRSFSDAVTTDAARVSGAFHGLVGATQYNIPVQAIPEGDHQLWGYLGSSSGTGSVTFQWGAQSVIGSTVVGDVITGQTTVNIPAFGVFYMVPLARITLPTVHIGPAGFVQIGLDQVAGTPVIQIDEAYLFAMDKGRLTVVDCGLGTPAAGTIHNRLRVAAPSLEVPFGRIEVATAADWSDAFTPNAAKVLSDQTGHQFDPDGGSFIFTVTPGTLDPSVSFSHYPRWHSNAGTP